MIFTRHAVERYRQFWMLDQPTATDAEAREILERFGPAAIHTGAKTHLGDPIWRIEALGIEIVGKNESGVVTCVTVLPPPVFRGLTPLQAEAVEASMRSAGERVVVAKLERDELRSRAPIAGTKPTEPAAEKRRNQRLEDLNPIAKLAQAEQLTLAAVLKTMRTQLAAEVSISRLRNALKIAVRTLCAINGDREGWQGAEAEKALAEISSIDPGLVSDEFVAK